MQATADEEIKKMSIKFHWRMLQGGEEQGGSKSRALGSSLSPTGLPDLMPQIEFCKTAEAVGIDGLLVDIGAAKPDPIVTTAAFGLATKKIAFIVAARSGLQSPTTFVQQINTLSNLIGGDRLLLNIVAGHSPKEQRYYGDFLDHDQRYARTEDFLAVCHRFWRDDGPVDYAGRFYQIEGGVLNTSFSAQGRQHPLLFIAGGSDTCRDLAVSQGDIWMRLADTPEAVGRAAAPVLAAGKQLGLRLAVIVRPTRAEALAAARTLIGGLDPKDREASMEKKFVGNSDSVSMKTTFALAEKEWLTPTLWTGAIRTHGAPAACLVGDPDEVAGAFLDYKQVGVTHFILSGWPKQAEMVFFGNEVIPRVRAMEANDETRTNKVAALSPDSAQEIGV